MFLRLSSTLSWLLYSSLIFYTPELLFRFPISSFDSLQWRELVRYLRIGSLLSSVRRPPTLLQRRTRRPSTPLAAVAPRSRLSKSVWSFFLFLFRLLDYIRVSISFYSFLDIYFIQSIPSVPPPAPLVKNLFLLINKNPIFRNFDIIGRFYEVMVHESVAELISLSLSEFLCLWYTTRGLIILLSSSSLWGFCFISMLPKYYVKFHNEKLTLYIKKRVPSHLILVVFIWILFSHCCYKQIGI